MKSILFDLRSSQPINSIKYHGGGEYVKSIFSSFVKNYSDKCFLSVFIDSTLYLDYWIVESFERNRINVYDLNKKSVQEILDEGAFDVFFSGLPYGFDSVNIPNKTCFCGTIHGLRKVEIFNKKYIFK